MKLSGRWALSLTLIGLLIVIGWRATSNLQHKKQAVANSSVQQELPIQLTVSEVISVEQRPLALTVPLNGVVQAVNSAVVKAYVSGELRGLTVREGDSVKKGQQLARIDAAESEARWRQAQQQADASKAQLLIAQRNHDNNAALVQKGFISTTALATSQANLDTAKANLAAAQAAADATRKAVTDAVILSPMNGQIAQRFVQDGERVGVEARIVEVVDPNQLEIMAQLAPADSVQVEVGQLAELQVPGAAQGTSTVHAKVVRINPIAQTGSRTVATYLAIQDAAKLQSDSSQPSFHLRPGLFLQGSIITGNSSQLAIPLAAVRTDKPLPYVQVLTSLESPAASGAPERSHEQPGRQELRIAHRSVELGRQASVDGVTWVQVLKGLNAGERALAGSSGALREGTLVELAPAPETAPTDHSRSQ